MFRTSHSHLDEPTHEPRHVIAAHERHGEVDNVQANDGEQRAVRPVQGGRLELQQRGFATADRRRDARVALAREDGLICKRRVLSAGTCEGAAPLTLRCVVSTTV